MKGLDFEDQELQEIAGSEENGFTYIAGPPGVGKSTMCMQATARAVNEGKVIWLDSGENFSPERYLQIGEKKSLDSINILNPESLDDLGTKISRLRGELPDSTSLIVVDSLVHHYRRESDDENIQVKLRKLSRIFSFLAEISRKEEIPVLATGQVHEVSSGLSLVGGEAPEFWPDTILRLQDGTGNHTLTVERNRFGDSGDQRNYRIRPGGIELV